MDALAHILFLLISSTWAGPKSQACFDALLMEAYASAPLSVATAEVGKTHFVFRLVRSSGRVILTYGMIGSGYEPLVLPLLPAFSPQERAVSLRTLVTSEETIGVFVYTNHQRVFRIGVTPSTGTPYLGSWNPIAEGVSPLFQPIAHETLVEVGADTGKISIRHRGKPTGIGELKLVPTSFVAFADPSTPNAVDLGHRLTLWVVGAKPTPTATATPVRRLYSWSQSKGTESGRMRGLTPASFQFREIPLSISSAGGGHRDGVVVKSIVTRGHGPEREVVYRLHTHRHRRWRLIGKPEDANVRPVRIFAPPLLRGEVAEEKLTAAFRQFEITDPEALDVARFTLSSENPDVDTFPALFVTDYALLAEVFARPAGETLDSIDELPNLNDDPRPHGPRANHPEAWRQWVAITTLQGLARSCRSDDDAHTIFSRRMQEELETFPHLYDAPYWELLRITIRKMRSENDYKESP